MRAVGESAWCRRIGAGCSDAGTILRPSDAARHGVDTALRAYSTVTRLASTLGVDPPRVRSAGPQNASRREAALGGKRWSPGLLRPGCSIVTERPGFAFPNP